jgi:hypothetical protein
MRGDGELTAYGSNRTAPDDCRLAADEPQAILDFRLTIAD